MMKSVLTGFLGLGLIAGVGSSAYSQRQDEDYQERDSQNRAADDDRRDRNQDDGSNESWEQWFSDWWSDDEQSRQMSGDEGTENWGVQGFMNRHDENDDGYLSRDELPSACGTVSTRWIATTTATSAAANCKLMPSSRGSNRGDRRRSP